MFKGETQMYKVFVTHQHDMLELLFCAHEFQYNIGASVVSVCDVLLKLRYQRKYTLYRSIVTYREIFPKFLLCVQC